jgi:hypothetical protein
VPEVELEQVAEPSLPEVTAPHEKMLALAFVVTEKGKSVVVPGVVSVTVNDVLPVVWLAVAPAAALHMLIARVMLAAKSARPVVDPPEVPEGAVAKVPAVELPQVLVPAELPETLPQLKWVAVPTATARKGPGLVAATVKNELPVV